MSDDGETTARYRSHAAALRLVAHDTPDARTRMVLTVLADDFERRAETMEYLPDAESPRKVASEMQTYDPRFAENLNEQ